MLLSILVLLCHWWYCPVHYPVLDMQYAIIHTALATTEHFTGKYLVFMIVEFIYEENMRVVFHNVFSSTPEFIYIMMESENAGWTQDENDQTVVAGLACCLVRWF